MDEPAVSPAGDGPLLPSKGPVVVGIGASAGGLAALKTFFLHTPEKTGLAFVVVVHLAPGHESHLADLLQPNAKMPVQQVNATIPLEPDRIYVIPPGCNLSAVDTHLRLSDLPAHRGARLPIDHFFSTLAKVHDGASVGIVLTGTGADGTLGIQEIKANGGIVIVQDPVEAEFDGMPRSAVATGLADLVLPLKKIPAALLQTLRTEPKLPLSEDKLEADGDAERTLRGIFTLLRKWTGRDFSRYKRSTILRRIQRRMQLQQMTDLDAYREQLRDQADEARLLADDLLVTVSSFFRDPAIFEKLQTDIIPRIFDDKQAEDDVRVWSVGCATGEEAYSLAILFREEAGRHAPSPALQIFATDLHPISLQHAREGRYLVGEIEPVVSPERIAGPE